MKASRGAVTSIYAPCDVLDRIDRECDRLAAGDPRKRLSRSAYILRCVEQLLPPDEAAK